MLTGRDLLARVESAFPGAVRYVFQFPLTRIRIVSEQFRGLDDDARESLLCKRIDMSSAELTEVCNRVFMRMDLLTSDEPTPSLNVDRGHFWLRELAESRPSPEPIEKSGDLPPVVHFYGYKGGQARSSVLSFFAKVLASAGWRVLAIDVDAEAPSLDILFDVDADPDASLIGVRAGLPVIPVRVVTPPQGRGYVDALPFRPKDTRYDLDAAALAMEGNIHPAGLSKIIEKVARVTLKYDVVLIDHRTGLAATVPPWVRHVPGPIVVFSRMDKQWRHAKPCVRQLWSHAPEHPGVFISFNVNPSEPETDYRIRVWTQATEILDELAAVMSSRSVPGELEVEELEADDVSDHWIVWPYEPQFNQFTVPDPEHVGTGLKEKIQELRRLLRLEGSPRRKETLDAVPMLHRSGALDEGDLIQTQALRDLRAANNPYTFILGRKGTGKTRLLRALAEENLGEALVVAENDAAQTGIPPVSQLEMLRNTTRSAPEQFWWTLLRIALEQNDTNRVAMIKRLEDALGTTQDSLLLAREAAKKIAKRRTFLIDGLEVFPRKETFEFVEALFRTIAIIDSDPVFSGKVRIRVFIRTDLAERGFENFEQQSDGRTLRLGWDTRTILNFALSRMGTLPWFSQEFPDTVKKIETRRAEILQGALSEHECNELLLEVFPQNLRRLNMFTTTFLRTYFSDDPKGQGAYYPRIYGDFLRIIANDDKEIRKEYSGQPLEDGRVSELLMNFAHERAAKEFLKSVKQELRTLVTLTPLELDTLIDVFSGTVTPFVLENHCAELAKKTRLDVAPVREAFDRMKTLGIFEERPKYPGQWRAGRLFKTSLGMIYNRKRKSGDSDD